MSHQIRGITVDALARKAIREHTSQLADIAKQTLDLKLNNMPNGSRQCIVSFLDDDGKSTAYNTLKAIFEPKNIAWSMALIPNGSDQMSLAQMAEAYNMGCEFASHTMDHVHLPELTDEQIEYQLSTSKQVILSKGYDCDYIVYPFGESNASVREIAKKYYKFGVATGGAVNGHPVSTFDIKRVAVGSYFDGVGKDTLSYYKSMFDKAYNDKTWIIFMTHGSAPEFDSTQQGYLASLIDYIQATGTPIMTVGKAYELMGNMLSVGDGSTEKTVISNTGDIFSTNLLLSSEILSTSDITPVGTGTGQTLPVNFVDGADVKFRFIAGGTISNPKIISTGKNLWGGLKAANDVITAVNNASYAYYTTVDGRRCLALVGNEAILVAFFTGVFKPSTVYTFRCTWRRADGATGGGGSIRFKHTDGSYTGSNHPLTTTWTDFSVGSTPGKSVESVYGNFGSSGQITYIDIDTIQIQEGAAIPTYAPYKESCLELTATLVLNDIVSFENGKCFKNATRIPHAGRIRAFKDGVIYVTPAGSGSTIAVTYPLNNNAALEIQKDAIMPYST